MYNSFLFSPLFVICNLSHMTRRAFLAIKSHNKTRLHRSKEIGLSLCLQHCKTLERNTTLLTKLNSWRVVRFSFRGDNAAAIEDFLSHGHNENANTPHAEQTGCHTINKETAAEFGQKCGPNQTSGGWLETHKPDRTKRMLESKAGGNTRTSGDATTTLSHWSGWQTAISWSGRSRRCKCGL